MDLDDIRLKEPEDLSDEEKGFLKENSDELTDDEKETYKDALVTEEEDEEESGDKSGGLTFKNEAELDAYLDNYSKKRGGEEEEEEEEKDEKTPDFFPSDYKPKDWNQPFKEYTPKMKQMVREEIQAMKTEEEKRKQNINKQFDDEIESLRRANKDIPATGTEDRKTFERELAQVIVEYPGVRNMTEAYNIKRALDSGGKKKGSDTKDVARKVGTSGGGEGEGDKEVKYEKFASRDLDAAHEVALRKLEETS